MSGRFQLRCEHCKQAFEYPSRCSVEGWGTEEESEVVASSATVGRRLGLPTVCLRCGQLGVHRADSRRSWRCNDCGSLEIHQLGFDPRSTAVVVGAALAVLLVGLPATSSLVWALPGFGMLGLLAVAGWLLELQGQANLSRAPCSVCGDRGLRERRIRSHPLAAGADEVVVAHRPR
jgi:uncharacterized protein (DUF983 family)